MNLTIAEIVLSVYLGIGVLLALWYVPKLRFKSALQGILTALIFVIGWIPIIVWAARSE